MKMRSDTRSGSDPLRRRLRRLSRGEAIEEARSFVEQFHRERGIGAAACRRRRRDVTRDLRRHGFYEHTTEELEFGAKVAWRNHARCIGRLMWDSLEVIDCRAVISPDDVASRVFDHLRRATGAGAVRSLISIFSPAQSARHPCTPPPWIESRQVLQYAGYQTPKGGVIGDRLNVEATRTARAMGWSAPRPQSGFDILPLMIRDSRGRRLLYEVPSSCYREIQIRHPFSDGLSDLGLRWYSVPVVSSMILTIGGIDYPCSPFNGHYMATEIACRNFADERRYDLLPTVANALGIKNIDRDSLWKDRATTELLEAVLHSFRQEGATIVDHHDASEQFMRFTQQEARAGRAPSGDWAWIVPPAASASCPVYHVKMHDRSLVPNFYHATATDGACLGPDTAEDAQRSRTKRSWDGARRSWYRWRRSRT